MFPRREEAATQVHQARASEVQSLDRSPAGRGGAEDQGASFAPGEVVLPAVLAGMKERNQLIRDRVTGLRSGVLVVVAALTGKRQVLGGSSTFLTPGLDVL